MNVTWNEKQYECYIHTRIANSSAISYFLPFGNAEKNTRCEQYECTHSANGML